MLYLTRQHGISWDALQSCLLIPHGTVHSSTTAFCTELPTGLLDVTLFKPLGLYPMRSLAYALNYNIATISSKNEWSECIPRPRSYPPLITLCPRLANHKISVEQSSKSKFGVTAALPWWSESQADRCCKNVLSARNFRTPAGHNSVKVWLTWPQKMAARFKRQTSWSVSWLIF